MKKTLIFVLFICNLYVTAQTTDSQVFDYQSEVSKLVNIPNSPESQAFTKYGDVGVSLYTGVPDINVPVHVIKGRELDLPISLTYDASGIKVEQIATWVGLGWNLNIGGRISRQVNGLADDYLQGGYNSIFDILTLKYVKRYREFNNEYSSISALTGYFDFLRLVNSNHIDSQPDFYSLNVMGLNETFAFDTYGDMEPKVLGNPRIKITKVGGTQSNMPISQWTVTGEDGTTYQFSATETTLRQNNDLGAPNSPPPGAITSEYYSSWLLTKVVSPNGKDVYDFYYTPFASEQQDLFASSASMVTNPIYPSVYEYQEPAVSYSSSPTVFIAQKFLNSIHHNGTEVVSLQLGNRYDTSTNSALNGLIIKNRNGRIIKEIDFDYGYFNLDGQAPELKNKNDIRLKLDNLHIKGRDAKAYQTYTFNYIQPDKLPSRNSLSQDYLGYYNGASNTVLYPKHTEGTRIFDGADREPSNTHSQIGLLNKITYPTGGHTQFIYENHDTYTAQTYDVVQNFGGLSLNGNSNTSNSLYKDSNGQYCDDQYLDYGLPKIAITTFTITEADYYTISYSKSGDGQASVANFGSGQAAYSSFCDFYQDPNNKVFWNSFSSKQEIKYLEAGKYQAMLVVDDNIGGYGSANFIVKRTITKTKFVNAPIGGHRVSEISDYTAEGIMATTKTYKYIENNKTTSNVNYKPVFAYTKPYYGSGSGSTTGPSTQLVRTVAFPQGDQPYVTYSSVLETVKKISGNGTFGSTRYRFYQGTKGSSPRPDVPYENNFYGSQKIGQLSLQQQYNSSGTSLSQTGYDYQEAQDLSSKGFAVYQDENYSNSQIAVKKYSKPDGTIYYVLEYLGKNLITTNNICTNPAAYGYEMCLDDSFSPLRKRSTFARGMAGGVSVIKSEQYNYSGMDTLKVNNATYNYYDPNIDYLVRSRISNTSNDSSIKEVFYYPKDNLLPGASNLVSANRLSEVMKTVSSEISTSDGTEKNIAVRQLGYAPINSTAILPTTISTSKGDNAMEDRVRFKYDSISANLKEAYQDFGPHTFYLWGYDSMYPVAKIENATYDQVMTTGVNMTVINSLTTTADDMRFELDKIRNHPSMENATVNTYTYDPQIGVTSMTDASGYTFHYYYDPFNRLSYIEDAEDHVIKKYSYNYDGQQQEGLPALSANINLPPSALLNNNTLLSTSISGGSGSFVYQWKINGQTLSSNSPSLSYTFEATGDTQVSFTVIDLVTGLSESASGIVSVYTPLSTPSITSDNTHMVKGSSNGFTISGIGGGSGNRSYEWYINSVQQLVAGTVFSPTFGSAGTYTVTFRVKDNLIPGHYEEASKIVYVYEPLNTPGVAANPTYVVNGTSISFTTSGIGGGSGSYRYEWDVNNVMQPGATGTSFSYIPPSAATYTVKFVVRDDIIPNHYVKGVITVYSYNSLSTPNLSADKTYIIEGNNINFTTSGIGGGSGNRRYEWYINNVKQTSTSASYNKQFTADGTYTIKFRVIDTSTGQYIDRSKTVYVYNPLIPGTISVPSTITVGNNTTFNINPSGAGGTYTYYWTITSPWKTYNSSLKSFALPMDYDYYGVNSISCKVTDTKTGDTKTVNASFTVNGASALTGGRLTSTTVNTTTYSKRYRVTVQNPSNGSGYYSYKWYRNGSSILAGTSSNIYVEVNCTLPISSVECEITDTRTGQVQLVRASFRFIGDCSGGQ